MADSSQVSNTRTENQDCVGIILAAGMGKRMKTSLPKVAHTALGKPLVLWAVESLLKAGVENVVVVISPKQTVVEELLRNYAQRSRVTLRVAYQETALGTAHAARCGLPAARELLQERGIPTNRAQIIVGFGDTPAVSAGSFGRYLKYHREQSAAFTLLAFEPSDNTGYGRILTSKDSQGNVEFLAIREEKDCDAREREVRLCNSGFLCASFEEFENCIAKVGNDNAAKEYYLTDVPVIGRNEGKKVKVFSGIDESELAGVNSQEQLAQVTQFLQARIIRHWQAQGVQFLNPALVYLEDSVSFETDVVVEPFVYLSGNTHFKSRTRVPAFSKIVDGEKGN